MTTKQGKSLNSAKSGSNGGSHVLPDFVSCELDDAQKAECKKNVFDDTAVFDTLGTWVRAGFKLSLRWEDRSMAFAVWLTGAEDDDATKGLVLSARGPSIQGAVTVLAYKHFTVLQENWRQAGTQGAKRDSWG